MLGLDSQIQILINMLVVTEKWNTAEEACRNAAASLGVEFSEEPGEAAFYGPKIDFVVKDVLFREWQLGTVQVDYNLPERFQSYICWFRW